MKCIRKEPLFLLAVAFASSTRAEAPSGSPGSEPESSATTASEVPASNEPSNAAASEVSEAASPAEESETPEEPIAGDERSHACLTNPWGPECADSCRADPRQLDCEDACERTDGIEFCPTLCHENPDLNCMPSYREPPPFADNCPIFQSKWRLGVRGVTGAQIRDRGAFYIGAEVLGGLRVHPNVSLLATAHIASGVDNRPWPIASFGASVGAEFLFYDALWGNSALVLDPEVGLWLPNVCFEDPCPLALPMATLGLRQMIFTTPTYPDNEGFQAFTFGLEGGVGYDPFLGIALGRAGLSFTWDLAF